MAPEIIKGKKYTEKVDIWSTGVICYMLLSGINPFPAKNKAEVKRLIVETQVDFNCYRFGKDQKDFMKKMLNKNAEQRWSAE